MRNVAPEGERSEEESTSISIEGSDSDADKVDKVSQGGRATQDNLIASLSEDESDMDDEEYALRNLFFKESQAIKPKFTSTTVDSHQYDLESHFLQKRNNGEGSPLETGINFILLNIDDRAHHHRRGTCFYWVLSYCGLRLPLTAFERSLLRILDVAPSQLTLPTWCHIASFQQLFEQIPKLIGFEPTVPIFGAFFNLYFTST